MRAVNILNIDELITEELKEYLEIYNITRIIRQEMHKSAIEFIDSGEWRNHPRGALGGYMTSAAVDRLIPLVGEHNAIHLAHRAVALILAHGQKHFPSLQKP